LTYVIIGNGPAGVSAIERIRDIDTESKIILISQENNPPYSRIMTPEYMTGEVDEADIFIRGAGDVFYAQHQIETRLGRKVTQVLPEKNRVQLDDGEEIVYDKLLIASGSRPFIPAWVDLQIEGVFTLWDKADSEAIHTYLPKAKNAVIIGGGLVGLQAARALHSAGIKVTVIEKMDRLMPLQLDQTASSLLLEVLKENDIEVLLDTEVCALITQAGHLTAIRTKDADISADMVLISIGVKPNLEMIAESDLTCDRGLLVDKTMKTSDACIYAAGDVAQAPCRLTNNQTLRALWLCAVQQGKVAGANMAGVSESYLGSKAMNSIQLFGLSILSFGKIESAEDGEEIILRYPQSGCYQKLVVQDGKLMGLIFVGDVQQAGVLFHKIGEDVGHGYWSKLRPVEPENIYV